MKFEKKNSELEKTIKNQDDNIKFLKKIVAEKEVETVN